ncbi:UPF0481 protein At3g47200-like [Alnus glutinosa]|uniref:UPF0481 protein At3g47200-like n=1 Tax=Alnus glutinosa TaxID=3517 RepID=UPI002D779006|nr:UPF0481 protein At3g47200-like [Alnus glutinosa]XP_062152884.1 UPF0481 protein At3g47200-like [Alnus glutinosa]
MAVNEERDSVRIDIERLESSIKDMMSHDSLTSPKCCIFKTPAILYRHNEKAFIPNAFSIGPLHHGCPNLKATEKIKAKYLQGLISRSGSLDTILKTLISSIMEVEKDARECYADAIDYSPEELVKILVIDGCFLIELFLKKTYLSLREEHDPIFSKSYMRQFLSHDLILLENQLPWMVLEILFDLTKDSYDENPLIILAMNFFDDTYLSYRMPPSNQVINIEDIEHFVDLFRKLSTLSSTDSHPVQSINFECIKHFVDLFRKLSTLSSTLFRKVKTSSNILLGISTIEESQETPCGWEFVPSATSLVESGVKFKRSTSQSILDVKFNDGVLEIPPFQIHEVTETVFRNLISYEQCHSYRCDRITSYAILLASLINTAKDVDILCDNKIIDNWLNPDDAAQLFNKLYLDAYVYYRYTDLSRQVNSFCQRRWPRWRRALVRNYFNTPWAILSTLAAVILLILTLVQTVYAVKK